MSESWGGTGSGWGNPVVGSTALRIPAINSPNFNLANPGASPSPSWAILQSGLAYFFGLILTGGTFTGPDYIINPQGAFFYTGTPAADALALSIVPSGSVADPFDNIAFSGVSTYSPAIGPGYFQYNTEQGETEVFYGLHMNNWTSSLAISTFTPTVVGGVIQNITTFYGGALFAVDGTTSNPSTITNGPFVRIPTASFLNGWVPGGGGNDFNGIVYRMNNDGSFEIWFDIINPAAKVNSTVYTFSSPFIPQKNQKHQIAGSIAGAVWATLDNSGNFIMTGNTAANAEINGRCMFYLGAFPP